MNTRSNFLSNATIFVLLAALTLAICIPVVAATNSTILTTTVPGTVPLLLELTGNGTVTVNGVDYTQSNTIEILRNSTVALQITPDTGHEIKTVIFNGCDYTKEVQNGKLTFPNIESEATLCVSFTAIVSTPQTGDIHSPLCLALLMVLSLMCMIAVFSFRKKNAS